MITLYKEESATPAPTNPCQQTFIGGVGGVAEKCLHSERGDQKAEIYKKWVSIDTLVQVLEEKGDKTSVSIGSRKGMVRLRWTHEGQDYDRSPGLRDIPLNRHTARTIAAMIEKDMALGQFDRTCEKYFPKHQDALPTRQLSTRDQ